MVEIIFVIMILVLVALAFNHDTRRKMKARREAERREASERQFRPDDAESRTIDLIGEKAYEEMTKNIDSILQRHGHQQCISFDMTCGPDTSMGAEELHKLLPGTPLEMTICSEGGVEYIDIYANGMRIGRLALIEAMLLRETMKENHLRAAYVAEQNCFGIENSHQLSIIVFYEPKKKTEVAISEAFPDKGTGTQSASPDTEICQN